MKQSIKWVGLATLLLAYEGAHATNPPTGWYGGLILGASYTPTEKHTFSTPIFTTPTKVSLTHSVFGNIAVEAGYRFNQLRAEGELLFNGNPYKELKVGDLTIKGVSGTLKPLTPSGMAKGLQLKGQTYTAALMGNVFYDFYTPGCETKFVPYVGAGIGYAHLINGLKFYDQSKVISGSSFSNTKNAPALQGIIGLSYYVDDFASFGLDFRYLTTKSVKQFAGGRKTSVEAQQVLALIPAARVQLASINLTVSGSFDCA